MCNIVHAEICVNATPNVSINFVEITCVATPMGYTMCKNMHEYMYGHVLYPFYQMGILSKLVQKFGFIPESTLPY